MLVLRSCVDEATVLSSTIDQLMVVRPQTGGAGLPYDGTDSMFWLRERTEKLYRQACNLSRYIRRTSVLAASIKARQIVSEHDTGKVSGRVIVDNTSIWKDAP